MAKTSGSTQFNCFSPPIMLATFTVETVMAIYTVWRYKLTVTTRLAVLALLALALFQLSEYYDCTGLGVSAETWSRVGYVSITTLPPLGLHLLHRLGGKSQRKLVAFAYATMVGYVAFLLGKTIFRGFQCTGNYVIFQLNLGPAWLYWLYYIGWLVVGITLGALWANKFQEAGKKARTKLLTVRGLIIGYLIFLVPTAAANIVTPASRRGIPSIMCGFAVLYACILTFYILPKVAVARRKVIDPDA